MSDPNPITRSIYTSQAADIEGFDSLAELALDMRRPGIMAPISCGVGLIQCFGN